jgi:hypothetical protein
MFHLLYKAVSKIVHSSKLLLLFTSAYYSTGKKTFKPIAFAFINILQNIIIIILTENGVLPGGSGSTIGHNTQI